MAQPTAYLDLRDPAFSTRSAEVLAAREAGWCARTPYGLAVLRHEHVGRLVRDRRLRQGSHAWPDANGLTGSFAEFWKRSIISQEGEAHRTLRHIGMSALAPDFVGSLTPSFDRIAIGLCGRLRSEEPVEFIDTFTEPFAGRAITTLLGLPDLDAPQVAADASALGLAMGINCKSHEPVFNAACDRLMDLADRLIARARAGGDTVHLVARLLAATAQHPVSDEILRDLVVIAIFGGVDTTRAQLGFALALFAQHPEQWDILRADLSLVPAAIEEVIRQRPTTTWSTRETVERIEMDGVVIEPGTILYMLVHASALDPAITDDPRFDITVKRKAHFGFGGGAHHCLGQLVARTDMAAALRAIAQRFERVEFAGTPEWLPDSGNTSPKSLPLRFVPETV